MKAAVLSVAALACARAASPPQFPQEFQVHELDATVVTQGSYEVVNGNIYGCPVPSNCKVQVGGQQGINYFDLAGQRTRFDSPGGSIVTLFKDGKTMAVDGSNKCTAYCPVSGSLGDFGLDPNASYVGKDVYQGQTVDVWEWQEKSILGVMSTTFFFVDTSGGSPVPVGQAEHLTPFGQDAGWANTTWTSFKSGTPAASLFDVTGISSCPKSKNCGNNDAQDHKTLLGYSVPQMTEGLFSA